MDDHPLDRVVWASLTTHHGGYAQGEGPVRRMRADYGIFAAAADRSPESWAALGRLIQTHGEAAVVEAQSPPEIAGTIATAPALCWQMIAGDDLKIVQPTFDMVELGDADGPQMLALATLTKPGPFFARTHQLGDFVGVKQDGRLVAMAGERLKLPGFTEVSGVCTHPDHQGRGYGAGLMSIIAARIKARGERPFLHVYAHNTGAIGLYEALGYRLRREMLLTMLRPA